MDKDECALGSHACHEGSSCLNSPGGYICQCPDSRGGRWCEIPAEQSGDSTGEGSNIAVIVASVVIILAIVVILTIYGCWWEIASLSLQ